MLYFFYFVTYSRLQADYTAFLVHIKLSVVCRVFNVGLILVCTVFSRPYYTSCLGYIVASVVCRPSVCPSVTLCIVAKRCVLQQKLLLTAYRKADV